MMQLLPLLQTPQQLLQQQQLMPQWLLQWQIKVEEEQVEAVWGLTERPVMQEEAQRLMPTPAMDPTALKT
jgi:hypothetical protein